MTGCKAIRFVIIYVVMLNASHVIAEQARFLSTEAATKALIDAVKSNVAMKDLVRVLGDSAKELLESGDEEIDNSKREKFLKACGESIKFEKQSNGSVQLLIGESDWKFPFPLVEKDGMWIFDSDAGREEIIDRRIGRNELSAMQAVLAYVDAQREYFLSNPLKDNVHAYAKKFLSSAKLRDGLYYSAKKNEPLSPLGELFGKKYIGKKGAEREDYFGYYYRILTAQGRDTPDGAYSYLHNKRMMHGHALIAWPAVYGETGVMTFMINHDGILYEKDLGADTNKIVKEIKVFNPSKSWNRVIEEVLKPF